jgi:hypothetical protein
MDGLSCSSDQGSRPEPTQVRAEHNLPSASARIQRSKPLPESRMLAR